MEIKTIRAKWMPGEERSEVYRLLNMVHAMAGSAANSDKRDGWGLTRTATWSDYVFTEWSNGIVEVGAETFKVGGEATSHEYYLRPVTVPNELEAK